MKTENFFFPPPKPPKQEGITRINVRGTRQDVYLYKGTLYKSHSHAWDQYIGDQALLQLEEGCRKHKQKYSKRGGRLV